MKLQRKNTLRHLTLSTISYQEIIQVEIVAINIIAIIHLLISFSLFISFFSSLICSLQGCIQTSSICLVHESSRNI
ncbi:Protein of unknown function [Gryllus bimaculatus]|nr:Protein of unknown function [Gryllus bimaculatus]